MEKVTLEIELYGESSNSVGIAKGIADLLNEALNEDALQGYKIVKKEK